MHTVDGILPAGVVSKLKSRSMVETSSFTIPKEDALSPACGVVGAVKLALVFWATLAALVAGWLTL